MLFINGGRQSGKTSKLIKMCARNGGYIVCRSKSMCGEIMNMARKMEVSIAFPLTYEEFIERRYFGKGISKFYIDDVDALLGYMTTVPIEAVTFTGSYDDGKAIK